MWQALQRWFSNIPYIDPLTRRHAFMIQVLLLMMSIGGLIDMPSLLTSTTSLSSRLIVLSILFMYELCAISAWVMLRRGMLQLAIRVVLVLFWVIVCSMLLLSGIQRHPILLFMWMLPLVIVGTLLDRKWLIMSTLLGLVSVLVISIAEHSQLWSLTIVDMRPSPMDTMRFFSALLVIVAICLDHLSGSFRKVITLYQQRSLELTKTHSGLEQTVSERNEMLFNALQASQQREMQLRTAMNEIEQQRLLIHSLTVPIIPISSSTLVMPLIGTLDERRFLQIREQALEAIEHTSVKQLVLDITGVPLVDDVMTRGLFEIVQATSLLGVETILVGIRPEVAYSIAQLRGDFAGLRTASTLQAFLS